MPNGDMWIYTFAGVIITAGMEIIVDYEGDGYVISQASQDMSQADSQSEEDPNAVGSDADFEERPPNSRTKLAHTVKTANTAASQWETLVHLGQATREI